MPDVVKAHGWTDDIVDFVFWVLVRNYYNTLQDYGPVFLASLPAVRVQRIPSDGIGLIVAEHCARG